MNVVVVLLDSLNRHLLGAYGSTEFDTPNLDRFAARATRFDRHVTGSLPCIPARHDLLCRRPRLPLAAVGLDRGVGGLAHPPAAARRRDHGARLGPPAPLRGRRRELPHRLPRLGLPARPRERPVAHPARPVVDRRAGRARPAVRTPTTRRARGSATRPTSRGRARWRRRRRGSSATRRTTTASSSSSTSSTRTSRSTRPSRGRRATTTRGRARGTSGRRTPSTPWRAASSTSAPRGTCAPTTARSCR